MIWDALKQAYADEFIISEDDLNYIVGMKGGKLSGRQKQRIAIARANLTKPKFFILDEAISELHYQSEKIVHKALNKVSKGITTIIIAHRLSAILNADKIIVLSDGKIVEEGNHKDLLSLNGLYSELFMKQLGAVDMLINENDEELPQDKLEPILNTLNENIGLLNNNIVKNKELKTKNSLDILQEKILEEKRKKEEIVKLAGEKRKKLWTIFGAAFFSICTGACWPIYGILLADLNQCFI